MLMFNALWYLAWIWTGNTVIWRQVEGAFNRPTVWYIFPTGMIDILNCEKCICEEKLDIEKIKKRVTNKLELATKICAALFLKLCCCSYQNRGQKCINKKNIKKQLKNAPWMLFECAQLKYWCCWRKMLPSSPSGALLNHNSGQNGSPAVWEKDVKGSKGQ